MTLKILQERFDEMYQDEHKQMKTRKNVGLPTKNSGNSARNVRMMEYRKKQRENKELERAARLNLLEVDVDEVKREQVASGALFDALVEAGDLYGVFEDLYGPDVMFRPSLDLQIQYGLDDDYVLPVHRGNVIKPSEAKLAPEVEFSSDEEGSLWTLVMSNPDGHFYQDEAEYLHWMVANIPSNGDISKGEVICPYLQPFPPFGTGFHRHVFVLYKQASLFLILLAENPVFIADAKPVLIKYLRLVYFILCLILKGQF